MDQVYQTDLRDALYLDDEDPEHSRWIHRDKLALIESHEMQEAGIKLPRRGRSDSKSNGMRVHYWEQGSRVVSRNPSRDQNRNGSHDRDPDPEEAKVQKSLRQEDGGGKGADGGSELDKSTNKDPSPDRHFATNHASQNRQQGLRSGSSRIPVPKSSPLPISQVQIERHMPFTRKRGTSGNWSGGDEDGIVYGKTRRRSHSVGSQAMLDDREPLSSSPNQNAHAPKTSSPSTSPSKRQASNNDSPPSSSNARKATIALRNASDPQKPRSSPTTTFRSSTSQRPKSRAGLESRPATAINRPEGDPPWLATMYKPDPRLPPDQQLLPTIAKRLQQEREASSGSNSISPLGGSIGPLEMRTQLASSPSPVGTLDKDEKGSLSPEPGWPLKASPTKENGSPGGGGTDHGGYSTIPKVQSAPTPPIGPAPSPKTGQRQQQQQQQQPQATQAKDNAEKEKAKRKEGGCACCVVM